MITCAKRIKFSPNVLKSDIWDKAREFYPFFMQIIILEIFLCYNLTTTASYGYYLRR
jgi:hypothetical protein